MSKEKSDEKKSEPQPSVAEKQAPVVKTVSLNDVNPGLAKQNPNLANPNIARPSGK